MRIKKLIVAAVLALSVSGAFAGKNGSVSNLGLGIAFNPRKITVDSAAEYDINSFGAGINLMGLGYQKEGAKAAGLTCKWSVNATFGSGDVNGTDMDFGMDFSLLLGVGYGFIKTDNMYLGLLGVIGGEANVLLKETSVADVTFIYTPVKVFSVYASCVAGVGFGHTFANMDSKVDGIENLEDDDDIKPYFVCTPVIGVCWKF